MPLFPLGIDVFSGNMISKHFLNKSILLQFLHCLQKCAWLFLITLYLFLLHSLDDFQSGEFLTLFF